MGIFSWNKTNKQNNHIVKSLSPNPLNAIMIFKKENILYILFFMCHRLAL